MLEVLSDLDGKDAVFIPRTKQLLSDEPRESYEARLGVMSGRLVQARVSPGVPMEKVAIELQEHF